MMAGMDDPHTHERRFRGEPDRLRSDDRIARLEVPRVVALCLDGLTRPRVLDVGTGTGVFAEAFAAKGLEVVGLDPNRELLDIARRHAPAARFEPGTAEALPFPDGSFDLVFLGHVLHETDEPLEALEEARRVARTRVAVIEWPHEDREPESGPPLAHRLRVETVLNLAARAGFPKPEHHRLAHMDFYRLTV
jgi:ubiquinone/menaquinone biosynthesis C-methylase UbiE